VAYERFGPYKVFESLGAGGMAQVHRATIEIGGDIVRDVALKRLLPQLADDKAFVEDFIREAKLAAELHHPNIVRMLELGRIGRTYFIAMELVRGHSLLQLMKLATAARAQTPIGVVVALVTELLDALEYASSCTDAYGEPLELVHRDLSPSNLIVDDDGRLKIIDFGVAKGLSGKFMTSSGLVKGKLSYMCSEALAGKQVDKRSDIFSIGVVAWELLTGRRLFKGNSDFDVIKKIRDGHVEPPSTYRAECSAELDEIVLHAVARDPNERWPSAGVMRRALETVRRTHRDGPQQVLDWKYGLMPELSDTTETTSMELSMRDLIVEGARSKRVTAAGDAAITPVPPNTDELMLEVEPTEFVDTFWAASEE
jgi:serine/threonine protein kinase